MSLNFSKLPEQKEFKKGKFIRPGVQNLILHDLHLQVSGNTGTERPVFSMETEPVTDAGWEGHEGAKGQIGNISGNFGYYLKNDNQKGDFASNLKDIMKAVGTFEAFSEKHGSTDFTSLTDVIDAVKPFIVDTKARYFVAGQQYLKQHDGSVGLRLKFPSKRLVEAIDSPSKFDKFDETNPKHFEKLNIKKESVENTAPVEDLPF